MDPWILIRSVFTQCGVLDALSVAAVVILAWRLNKTLREKDELQRQARQDALDRLADATAHIRAYELALLRLAPVPRGKDAANGC